MEELKDGTLLHYLCVDEFITDMVAARALSSAFELAVIDTLASGSLATYDGLAQEIRAPQAGLKLLLRLLENAGVLEKTNEQYRLTDRFSDALQYRDLLLAKLDFAHIASHDFIHLFSVLIADPVEFMKRAGMFRLFNYGNALVSTPESRNLTARWVRITTMLTRYEAQVCFALHPVGAYRRMLDVGGNSGEFALQACRANPGLAATVFDLPVVCDVGSDHIRHEPEAGRIHFSKGNARTDILPEGNDLITFKSMLHDWPDEEARAFLRKACRALEPGGTLLIFERGPFEIGEAGLPYSIIPFLLFAHTFRSPDLYVECLAEGGLSNVSVTWIDLEMPFFLVTGSKSNPRG